MSKLTKCLVACTVCKIWTLANGLLISWLCFNFCTATTKHIPEDAHQWAHDETIRTWSNWWAEPLAWSSGIGIACAVVFTAIADAYSKWFAANPDKCGAKK